MLSRGSSGKGRRRSYSRRRRFSGSFVRLGLLVVSLVGLVVLGFGYLSYVYVPSVEGVVGGLSVKDYGNALGSSKYEQVVVTGKGQVKGSGSTSYVELRTDRGNFVYNPSLVNFLSTGSRGGSALRGTLLGLDMFRSSVFSGSSLADVERSKGKVSGDVSILGNLYGDLSLNRLALGVPISSDGSASGVVSRAFKTARLGYLDDVKRGDVLTLQYFTRSSGSSSERDIITLYKSPADQLIIGGGSESSSSEGIIKDIIELSSGYLITLEDDSSFTIAKEDCEVPEGSVLGVGSRVSLTSEETFVRDVLGSKVDSVRLVTHLRVSDEVTGADSGADSSVDTGVDGSSGSVSDEPTVTTVVG